MRAIVVDDEKLALESLRGKLTHIGRISEVHPFSAPEEALAFFEEYGADIAFLDINMAQMDGLTLAKRLRQIRPDVLIIFVTGYAEYSLDAIKLHADGYLMKPFGEEDVNRVLDELAQLNRIRHWPQTAERIRIQCFGHFEVFADNKPVAFSRAKSKELLAYLVDRRGAKCSAAQIAAVLWDDGLYDRSRQKQLGGGAGGNAQGAAAGGRRPYHFQHTGCAGGAAPDLCLRLLHGSAGRRGGSRHLCR